MGLFTNSKNSNPEAVPIIPSYLQGFTADATVKDDSVSLNIADSQGGRLFEIWYYGQPFEESDSLIVRTEFSASKFAAKSIKTGEIILLFDGAVHGYDSMFCDVYTKEQVENRPLQKLNLPPTEIRCWFSYNIPYDEERDNYEFDENGNCVLVNGTAIPWEKVKTDGYDWVTLYYKNEKGRYIDFVDEELA